MKKILAIGLAMCAVGMTANTYAADAPKPVIAVVNVQEIFQQSPRISDLNKQLQKQFKPRQDKLIAAQKSLQDEMDAFKKDSATMNQKEKDKLQKKIASDQDSLSKDAGEFQQDLGKEQKRILGGVQTDLNNIIASISKKNGYTLVLDSQAVVFSSDSTDITKDVMKQFDSK
ncbi:MAG: OmpH family outer membrane protein [Gammaproteobacteria bacterium]|nr:OmpH family outer membrane protein [Gammaproteobacteria bacterium]